VNKNFSEFFCVFSDRKLCETDFFFFAHVTLQPILMRRSTLSSFEEEIDDFFDRTDSNFRFPSLASLVRGGLEIYKLSVQLLQMNSTSISREITLHSGYLTGRLNLSLSLISVRTLREMRDSASDNTHSYSFSSFSSSYSNIDGNPQYVERTMKNVRGPNGVMKNFSS
jgi:hypothetical protein